MTNEMGGRAVAREPVRAGALNHAGLSRIEHTPAPRSQAEAPRRPLVLLPGWPQSWYAWRDVMPALAEQYTVYALDLPGLGDSDGAPTGYDKATLARYVHGLVVDELDLDDISLVGHDLGAGVGFQYAAKHPDGVARYAHLDYPLPGPALSAMQYRTFSWHLAFHDQEVVPETVVDDDVREYLALFYPQAAFGGVSFGGAGAENPFSDEEVDEFARTYSRPEVLTGGFELYRTLDQDELDNTAAQPMTVPTMLMTAEGGLASTRSTLEPRLSNLVRAVEVPKSGHWLMEENLTSSPTSCSPSSTAEQLTRHDLTEPRGSWR